MRNTKSLLALFLACMMVMSCIVAVPAVAADVAIWDSTADPDTAWYTADPEATSFEIGTAAELAGLASIVNDGTDNFSGDTITLTADIYLNDVTDWSADAWASAAPANNWTPIGNYHSSSATWAPFNGTFDGAGFTVYGMYADGTGLYYTGLFGAAGMTIKNLNISNAYVKAGNNAAGIVCGAHRKVTSATFTIENVAVVDSYLTTANNNGTAAILGRGGSVTTINLNNCDVSGTTVTGANTYTAGMFGYSSGTVTTISMTDCDISDSEITGANYTAGMLGNTAAITTVSIDNCSVDADINGAINTAGLVACIGKPLTTFNVTNSYVGGTIDGTRGVSGVWGEYRQNTATVFNVSNTLINSAIKGTWGVGGIFGYSLHANAKMTVENVVVTGSLETTGTDLTDSSRVGGTDIGALVGAFGYAGNTTTENVAINNFYYNAKFTTADTTDLIGTNDTTNGRLGSFYGTSAVNADTSLKDGYVFYTPMTDTTSAFGGGTHTSAANTVAKADNMGIADFVVSWKNGVGDLDWFKAYTCDSCTSFTLGTNADGDEVVLSCDKMCANALVKVGAAWDGGYTTEWYNNGVTENDVTTYTISSAKDLAGLAAIVNGTADGIEADDFAGDVIKLAANIYLNDAGSTANAWTPIGYYDGSSNPYFAGTFDGDNKTISGLYMTGTEVTGGRVSLFGNVGSGYSAVIKNLTITNANVTAGAYCAAILIAFVTGDASDVEVNNVTIKNSVLTANNNDGTGVVFAKLGSPTRIAIIDCDITATVNGASKNYIAGLIGNSSGSRTKTIDIKGTTVDVDITSGGAYVGGFIGNIGTVQTALNIENSKYIGDITATGQFVGGFVGRITTTAAAVNVYGSSVEGAIAGSTTSEGELYIGGMIGYVKDATAINITSYTDPQNPSSVKNSTVSATVSTTGSRVGGIIGQVNGSGKITINDTDFTGKVTAYNNVGGFIGEAKTTGAIDIDDCTISGNVSYSKSNNFYGGVIGCVNIAGASVTMDNIKTTSNATIKGNGYTGMLVGALRNFSSLAITNCDIDGTVSGSTVGGAVGGVYTGITADNTVAFTGVSVTCTNNGTSSAAGLISLTGSGTTDITVNNCRVEMTSATMCGLAGSLASGDTITVGNNVVIGDCADVVSGGSGTVTQTTGTKIYTKGTVGNTAEVATVTAADEAVVAFANAWKTATASYTSWTCECDTCTGTNGWVDKANPADGQYKISCLDLCQNVVAEERDINLSLVGSSVRFDDPVGIRFTGRIYVDTATLTADETIEEFGIMLLPVDLLATNEFVYDNENVAKVPVTKFVQSGSNYLETASTFNAVLYDIPDDATDRAIAVKVYVKYTDGTVIYSDAGSSSYIDVASQVITDGNATDMQKKGVAEIVLKNTEWCAANPEEAAKFEAIVNAQ